ncbi:hypothetical protein ACH3VS_39305 [Streptomyces sp. WSLK1-3]|uniref:hypothetical protein n=1 Tax=Streptomyces sp. WSLK1-3 TaxID=3375475 RepID=UPI0037A06A55
MPQSGQLRLEHIDFTAETVLLLEIAFNVTRDSPWDAKAGTRPVMWNGHDGENQQWVLALPFGKASADAAR